MTEPKPRRQTERKPAPEPPEDPRSEEPDFVNEPDLPAGEPSGEPTRKTKPHLPSERKP
jgi:hypothetical protein